MAKMKSIKDQLDKLKTMKAKPDIDDALSGLMKPLLEEKEVTELLSELNEPVVETVLQKIEEVKPVLVEKPKVAKPKSANHIAYNVYWDDTLKKYCMVTIEYNLRKDEALIISTEELADNAAVALHKLNAKLSLKLLKKEEVI